MPPPSAIHSGCLSLWLQENPTPAKLLLSKAPVGFPGKAFMYDFKSHGTEYRIFPGIEKFLLAFLLVC